LCGAYAAARAFTHGTVEVAHFRPVALTDTTILELAERVTLIVDENPDPNVWTPITVSVTLKDGAAFSTSRDFVLGSPLNPLTRDEHLAKFSRNCASARPEIPEAQIEALIERFDKLEDEADVASLVDLMIA